MKNTKKNVLDDLRAKIGQQIRPSAPTAPSIVRRAEQAGATASDRTPHAERPKTNKTRAARKQESTPQKSTGRGVHIYVDDTDHRILNSLAVWFGSQDRRMSDSQVIKAAIRLAVHHQSARLLEIADEVRSADRRRLPKSDRPEVKK